MSWLFCLCLGLTQFFVVPAFASPSLAAQLVFLGGWVGLLGLAGFREGLRLSAVNIGIALLTLLLFISAAHALAPMEGLRYALAFLPFLALSLLTTATGARDSRLPLRLAQMLMSSGLVAALLGFYEYGHFLLLGPSRRMLIPYLMPPDNSLRVGGMYGQANLFALFLVLALISSFLVYLHHPGPLSRSFRRLRLAPVWILATTFFLTGSRSGLLALAAVLLVLVWLVGKGRYLGDEPRMRREFFLLLGTLVLGYATARTLPGALEFISQIVAPAPGGRAMVGGPGQLRQTLGDSGNRILLWSSALLMFLRHPWLGIGPDNFKLLLAPYQVQAHDMLGFVTYDNFGFGYWAHNEILQLLAELGIGGLIAVLALLYYLGRRFRDTWRERGSDQIHFRLYLLLLLLPVLVQALVSWPLRYPGILALFVVFLSLLPAPGRVRQVLLPAGVRGVLVLGLIGGVVGIGAYGYHEYRFGQFLRQVRHAERPSTTFARFTGYADRPFDEFRALLKLAPLYVGEAIDHEDKPLARRVIPYALRLARLQGAFWEWYDVARLYHLLGDNEQAAVTVQKAIDLQPEYQPAWQLQHRLHTEEVARKTGLPMEHFYPKLDASADKLMQEMMDDSRNRTQKPD